MAIESVGSQTQVLQTSQAGGTDTARVDERETSKVEERDVNQNDKEVRAKVQIKDSNRGASVDIIG